MRPHLNHRHLLATLVAAFVTVAGAAESDSTLRELLVGTWYETRVVDCATTSLKILLKQNGTFEVRSRTEGCGPKSGLTLRGKWEVRAGRFNYTTTYSDPGSAELVGESFSDEIVSVSPSEWVMIEGSTGKKSIAKRVEKP